MACVRLLVFLSVLLYATAVTSGRLYKPTNADRFARGLPPLRPERLFNASRTGPHLSRRSGLPTSFLLGVYEPGQTTPECYLGQTSPGSLPVCVGQGDALMFTSNQPEGSSTPTALTVTSAGAYNGQVLTAEGSSASQGPNSQSALIILALESLQPSGPNAQPTGSSSLEAWGGGAYYETDVFYIAADGTLSSTWTNPTGSNDGPTTALNFAIIEPLSTPANLYGTNDPPGGTLGPVTIKVV